MKERLMEILMNELNYSSPEIAERTCDDLFRMEDPEIRQALLRWIDTREMTPVREGEYDAVSLARRLRYPSALLALNMLRKEPARAKALLKGFR